MFDKFSERHIGVSNEKDLKAMLDVIGVKSVDELISQVIPQSIRLRKPLALPAEGMSEYEFAAHIRELADRNQPYRSFIGMGYYPSAVPAVVTRNVFENQILPEMFRWRGGTSWKKKRLNAVVKIRYIRIC